MKMQHLKLKIFSLLTGMLFAGIAGSQTCTNRALNFDGYNDYINLPVINGLAPNSDFTVESWFTIGSEPLVPGQCTFRRLFALSGSTRFEVGQCSAQNLVVVFGEGFSHQMYTIPAPSLPAKRWHHLAVVRSGSILVLYLDGLHLQTITTLNDQYPSFFRIGHWGGYFTPGENWLGEVDEVRLWNVARTANQVATDAKSCNADVTDPSLLVYWKLDEGIPLANNGGISSAMDASLYGNHGHLAYFWLVGYTENYVCSDASPLDVQFTMPADAPCGNPVQFVNQTTGPNPAAISYTWDFGDGNSSSSVYPIHQLPPCNVHKICLTASAEGCSTTSCNYIYDEGPVVTCPDNVTVSAGSSDCSVPAGALQPLSLSDNCGVPTLSYKVEGATQLSGPGAAGNVLFNKGISTVTYFVEDNCGSTSFCTFSVTVDYTPCDVKTNGCLQFELLSIRHDNTGHRTYRMQVTNNCGEELLYFAARLPNGQTADAPADNTQFVSEWGRPYLVRNPAFSPYYSIRFTSQWLGIANGESDIFEYTLSPQASNLPLVQVAARLAGQPVYTTNLSTGNCKICPVDGGNKQEARMAEYDPTRFIISPNPNDGNFNIELPEPVGATTSILVLDLTGRLIFEEKWTSESEALSVRAGDLSPGLYFLQLMSGNKVLATEKFVKQ